MLKQSCIAAIGVAALLGAAALAQTPGTAFNYQGRLNTNGQPADGPHDMRFQLWISESDPFGPKLCKDNVAVTDGLFTTELDFGPNIFLGLPLWLEIEVRADATAGNCGTGSFTTLAPRQPLTPTPYAIWATTAQTAGLRLPFTGTSTAGVLLHLTNTSNGQNTSTGFFENYSTGNNSRGLTSIANGSSGLTYGVYGQSNSTAGYGVYGTSSGQAGIKGDCASTAGAGVFGLATATSGTTFGVRGESASTSGIGVYGHASAATGGTTGVYGWSQSSSGIGIQGEGNLTGVYGKSLSGNGGEFITYGSAKHGVQGRVSNNTGTGAGVYASTTSPAGYGIYASAPESGTAIYGVAGGGAIFDSSYAIFGENLGTDPFFSKAGYFIGYVTITRSLGIGGDLGVSGTKSFKIDHPADPANKYLLHYCAEGPEPLNVYRGNAVLDEAGQAWIELPDYFARINRDVSYTLTPIGAAAPSLHVAQEVRDNRFQIAGGQPGQKVSWRVEAVRNDPWVRTHGAPVEVEKHAGERGKYQHPDLYGQPEELGLDYRPPRANGTHPTP